MVHYELLSKTVLCLVLIVCESAQSLETGCKYPSDVSIAKDDLHYDLKCTYIFSGLTHMLVTKHLFGPPSICTLSSVIGKIIRYNNTAKKQMYSLYFLGVSIDALWVLHLYMATLLGFYEKSLHTEEVGQKIIDVHDYVIRQLREDLKGCRGDNSFNNEWKIFRNGIRSEKELTYLMDENVAKVKDLLRKNKHEYDGNTLQIGNLLMNNMGSKNEVIQDIMNVFNVQVEWSRTGILLTKSWREARYFFWTTGKFESLKLYYKLSFDILKIIMFRLSLKHLHYLDAVVGQELYVHYAKEWYYKVQQFGDMLNLSEDLHVKHLLISFDNLVKLEETMDSVACYIITILNELCLPIGCKSTKGFELNRKEFKTPFKSSYIHAKDCLKVKKSPVPIKYNSLENTRMFLYFLSWLFKQVDFNHIRLLIEYINELNPGKCIDRLEECYRVRFNFDYL